ncbi:hypothetical protein EC957_000121 [Mortierella hygrophila]|uniref:Uncharacterized protein n=1 Tax=Mortierella hygrophila TaxID=979708 RepID=A0A9P6FIZ6_9FUNG|nr:hypothetical protein EC957_000012 [Mortierella hygrophila]KAF9552048.1 hypothetical protein EC957_000121 [Mortierella hygrophila]
MTATTPTSLSSLEQYTWASPLAPSMESEEYVFILSCLQPYIDMARLCRMAQRKQQFEQPSSSIVLALSCMNQYEIKRACQEWRAIIVHIDPECCVLTASCAVKTLGVMKAIPRGYDVVKVRDEEAGMNHLFLVRRDYTQKNSVRIVPMYLLSGLGLGTIILGARIAFKIRKIAN